MQLNCPINLTKNLTTAVDNSTQYFMQSMDEKLNY